MTIRQEIHSFIDEISESKLAALKPLLCALADESMVIETNLTDEERTIIAESMDDYSANPGTFIPLKRL